MKLPRPNDYGYSGGNLGTVEYVGLLIFTILILVIMGLAWASAADISPPPPSPHAEERYAPPAPDAPQQTSPQASSHQWVTHHRARHRSLIARLFRWTHHEIHKARTVR
jgi:hypothetical protein